jgi:hypothetical protein
MPGDADSGGSDLSRMKAPKPAVHRSLVSLIAYWGQYAIGIGLQDPMWRLCPAQGGAMRDAAVKLRKDL